MRLAKTINRAVVIFILSLCSSCKTNSPHLFELIDKACSHTIDSNTRAVILVTDKTCLTCNQWFSEQVEQLANDKDIKIVISADPNRIDYRFFEMMHTPNVFIDTNEVLKGDTAIKSSAIYYLKYKAIDSCILLTFKNIDKINEALEKLKSK